MENNDLALAQIVSAIISKEDVIVGADVENGISIHIKATKEIKKDYRGTIKLEDLIKLVKKAL